MMTAERAAKAITGALLAHKAETARIAPVRPEDYAPYHDMKEFDEGAEAYFERTWSSPYMDGVAAQAWDRGYEFAMRKMREAGGR